MKIWIARDKNGLLQIFNHEPEDKGGYWDNIYHDRYIIDKFDPIGKGVKFENSPQKLTLVRG